MSNGRKKVSGGFAAAVLLMASLAAGPAIAKKPPPPPPPVEDPDDPWLGCTPEGGSYIYGVDCCDYPELIVPCESAVGRPDAAPRGPLARPMSPPPSKSIGE